MWPPTPKGILLSTQCCNNNPRKTQARNPTDKGGLPPHGPLREKYFNKNSQLLSKNDVSNNQVSGCALLGGMNLQKKVTRFLW